jgi:hypothetical protein
MTTIDTADLEARLRGLAAVLELVLGRLDDQDADGAVLVALADARERLLELAARLSAP